MNLSQATTRCQKGDRFPMLMSVIEHFHLQAHAVDMSRIRLWIGISRIEQSGRGTLQSARIVPSFISAQFGDFLISSYSYAS